MSNAPNLDPERMIGYRLNWPAWLAGRVSDAADARAMSVATWLREAAIEKLERTGVPARRESS